MKPPIIINDSNSLTETGDLIVYETVELAELSREIYDVGDDWIHCFDSEGFLLKLIANDDKQRAKLVAAEDVPSHRDVLIALLRQFLLKIGSSEESLSRLTLEGLIKQAQKRSG